MLENMHRIMEKMDAISKSFSGMSRRHVKRENQNFKTALNEITKADLSSHPISPLESTAEPKTISTEDLQNLINKHATEKGIKPELVQKLIDVASGRDPESVGNDGQLGLMQLKPEIFRQFGYTDPFDPDQNISAGTQHLSEMLKRNGGNTTLALAAYSSDPATVKRFGGIPPFPETQNFVGQILSGLSKPKSDD